MGCYRRRDVADGMFTRYVVTYQRRVNRLLASRLGDASPQYIKSSLLYIYIL